MTTDSVGIIIPEIIKTFHLSLTAAGAFQYSTMGGIAFAGFFLGHLADRLGRKPTIVAGPALFAAASYLFIAGKSFAYFCTLLGLSGISIGVFKTGALALIGDFVKSTAEHTSIMNTVEGFFGIGSIIGPALLAILMSRGKYVRAIGRHRHPDPVSEQNCGGSRRARSKGDPRSRKESLRARVFLRSISVCSR